MCAPPSGLCSRLCSRLCSSTSFYPVSSSLSSLSQGLRDVVADLRGWLAWSGGGSAGRIPLFPFFHYVRSPTERKTHLWPVYGVREYERNSVPWRSDSVMFPLFDYDRALESPSYDLALLGFGFGDD